MTGNEPGATWRFDPNTRPARLLLLATRAGLSVLAAVLAWDAGVGTAGAVLVGSLVAWALHGWRAGYHARSRRRRPR